MRRQMWRSLLAAAVLGLMAGAAAPARAQLITTFTAEGTFQDGATLSGTLMIDTSTGTATAANLVVSAPDSLTYDEVQTQGTNQEGNTEIVVQTENNANDIVSLALPTTTLVGYTGGPIVTNPGGIGIEAQSYIGYYSYLVDMTTGSLSVPEPSTLVMASLVSVCAIAYGVAKKRRAARNTTREA